MRLSGKLYFVVDSDREEADDDMKLKRRSQRRNPTELDLKAVESICKPITEGADFEKASKFKYLFADVDIAEDISLGLRGYNRNIDRLSN